MGAFVQWLNTHRNVAFWGGMAILVLFVLLSFRGCASTSTTGTSIPGSGWFFLKLAFAGLIVAAYASRESRYLAWTFSGLAVAVFLVLLGKLDNVFDFTVLGLQIFAAAGIWGVTQTDGRTKSFLGFASGAVILIWLYLTAKKLLDIPTGFLGDRVTDSTNLIIFFFAAGVFAFATWKRSKVWYAVFFVILAAWLGNDVFDQITKRYPKVLTPTISQETRDTWEEVWSSFMKRINEAVRQNSSASTTNSTSANKSSVEKKIKVAELIETVRISDPPFGRSFDQPLPPGEYYVDPVDEGGKRTEIFFCEDIKANRGQYRPLRNGRDFSVRKGEMPTIIKSGHSIVRLYRKEG